MNNHVANAIRASSILPLRALFLLLIASIVIACAPTSPPTTQSTAPSPAAGPKTLVMALQEEPISLVLYGRPSPADEGGTTGARYERYYIFHANLTMYDEAGNVIPAAAVKVPTAQDGDWKLNPDGTMEVTWKIRPDVYWHDGTPLTADDFAFGLEVVRDPNLGVAGLGELLNISGIKVIDDKTFVVSWNKTSIQGNTNSTEGIPAMPRQQLEERYRTMGPVEFKALPIWRDEFIGIGPYRVSRWEPGSSITAEAFPQYFLGKPHIDRLILRWVTDINVLTANLLAGVVDVSPPGTTMKPEQLKELKRQWDPIDGGKVFTAPTDIRTMSLNFRHGDAWAQDIRFRRAMMISLNRDQLVEVLQSGFTDVAYFLAFPEDGIYKLAEQRNLPKYPYDPDGGQRLFAEAGWTKGADGLLHNAAGEIVHFYCCRYPSADSNDIRESLAWGNDFRTAGLEVEHPLPEAPPGASSSEQRRVRITGPWGGQIGNFRTSSDQNFATFLGTNIVRQETQWIGINNSGWSNPAYEDSFTKSVSTLDAAPRLEIQFQMFQLLAQELPMLPAYYNPLGVAVRKGVEGIGKGAVLNRGVTWNIHTWDIR